MVKLVHKILPLPPKYFPTSARGSLAVSDLVSESIFKLDGVSLVGLGLRLVGGSCWCGQMVQKVNKKLVRSN